jgi:hypothetical protein
LDNPQKSQEQEAQILALPFIKGIRHEQNTIYANTHDTKKDLYALNQFLSDKQIPYFINALRMLAQGPVIDWNQLLSVGGLLLVLGAISFIIAVHSLNRDSH